MHRPENDNPRRVLVIDDNAATREDFRKILAPRKDAGHSGAAAAIPWATKDSRSHSHVIVDTASQGRDGLEKVIAAVAAGQPYALAFVDSRMPPGWDGLTTIQAIWREDPDIQVVICSAPSDNMSSEIQERLGATDQLLVLKKPLDHVEVSQLTRVLLEKQRLAKLTHGRAVELESQIRERTLHLQEARNESDRMLAAIDSVLFGLDTKGHVVRWNKSAVNLFGIEQCDALGQPFSSLNIDWEDREEAIKLTDSPSTRIESAFRDAEGSRRTVGLSQYPVLEGDQHKGSIILGMDLTHHRNVEQQLQQAQKLESVGQLAAGVAHEINTPMQYLGDNLDFLEKKMAKLGPLLKNLTAFLDAGDDATQRAQLVTEIQDNLKSLKVKSFLEQALEAIGDSRDGVHHVARIVRAMKEFAHPGQDEKMLVNIHKALESTIAVSTNEWKYLAEIETEFDETMPLIPAFPGELNQVFLNLVVNAAHAIGDVNDGGGKGKGKITLSTRAASDHVQIAISDTGAGIPDNIQQRIFDPFFTTKEVGKGTGQGLAICHSVVTQKHGGRLWFETSPGNGTTFFIQLPIPAIDESADSEVDAEMAC